MTCDLRKFRSLLRAAAIFIACAAGSVFAAYSCPNGGTLVGTNCVMPANCAPSPTPTSTNACTVSIGSTNATNPTSGTSTDGVIAASSSGTPSGSVLMRAMSSDGVAGGQTFTATSHTWSGLRANTYTVCAWDSAGGSVPNTSACPSQCRTVTLVGPPTPSPTPSPSPAPACNPSTDVATTSVTLICNYTCGGQVVINSGKCTDPAPINKVQTQMPGCSTVGAPTSCTKFTVTTNYCTASQVGCPAGTYLHLLWDAQSQQIMDMREPGGRKGVCATGEGNTPYYACSTSSNPPYVTYPGDFGSCTSMTGWSYSGVKKPTAPQNGGPYCTE